MNTEFETRTVTQAADWLEVSRETIYNWVKKGELEYYQDKVFKAEDLDMIRHNRVVAAWKEAERLQAIPALA